MFLFFSSEKLSDYFAEKFRRLEYNNLHKKFLSRKVYAFKKISPAVIITIASSTTSTDSGRKKATITPNPNVHTHIPTAFEILHIAFLLHCMVLLI